MNEHTPHHDIHEDTDMVQYAPYKLEELSPYETEHLVANYWQERRDGLSDSEADQAYDHDVLAPAEAVANELLEVEDGEYRYMADVLNAMDDTDWQKTTKERLTADQYGELTSLRGWIDDKLIKPEAAASTADGTMAETDAAQETTAAAALTSETSAPAEPAAVRTAQEDDGSSRHNRLRGRLARIGRKVTAMATGLLLTAAPAGDGGHPADAYDAAHSVPAANLQVADVQKTFTLPISYEYAEHFDKDAKAGMRTAEGDVQHRSLVDLADQLIEQGNTVKDIHTFGKASEDDETGHLAGATQPGFNKRSADNNRLSHVRDAAEGASLNADLAAAGHPDVPVMSLGAAEAHSPVIAEGITEAAAQAGISADELVIRANDGDITLSAEAAVEAEKLNDDRVVIDSLTAVLHAKQVPNAPNFLTNTKNAPVKAVQNPTATFQANVRPDDFLNASIKANARGLGFTGGKSHKQPRPFNYNRGNSSMGRDRGGSRGRR